MLHRTIDLGNGFRFSMAWGALTVACIQIENERRLSLALSENLNVVEIALGQQASMLLEIKPAGHS